MPFFCEIDHKLHFNIEIRVDSELLEQDLSQLFKNTIVTATNIKKHYDYFISKEGKILGQERIKLVESLDNIFIFLVIMRNRLEKNIQMDPNILKDLKFRVSNELKHGKFIMQGRLKKSDISKIQNFNKGYSMLIFNKIKDILLEYRNVMNDKSIINERLTGLYHIFDDILYNSLIIRYKLENCLIDN